MPKLAANISMMFTEWDFLDRFQAAADNGFNGVEFLSPYEHAADKVAQAKEKAGLEVALFNLPFTDKERGFAALPWRKTEFREALAKALDYAEALNCLNLHAMAGIPGANANEPVVADTFAANLTLAAERAAARGVNILIEPINTRDIPGFYLNYVEDAAAIIAGVNKPNLKLQFDIYHRQIMSGDVMMGMAEHLPLIGHVHVLHYLDELGFTGWVGCEYRPKAGTVEGLGWMKKLA